MGRWKYANSELIEQVRLLAQELGHSPTESEFEADKKTVSAEICLRRFGSWDTFLARAKLAPLPPTDLPDEVIIGQVLLMTCELGRVPRAVEFEADERTISLEVCIKHFGSWEQLLDAAGLKH